MTRTRLNPETRNQLGALLLSGITPTVAAERLGVSYAHAVNMRKKLVKAGTVQPFRTRKARKTIRPAVMQTPRTVKPASSTLQFRVNGVEFSVDSPARVAVENGMVDIKY
jgi:hypothetical protein